MESKSLVVAGDIDCKGRNVVEGNLVQLQAGVSTAQARTKSAKKLGLAAGRKVVLAKAGTWSKETGFTSRLEGSSAMAGTEAVKKPGSNESSSAKAGTEAEETGFLQQTRKSGAAAGWSRHHCRR